jgi:hypothetical protein
MTVSVGLVDGAGWSRWLGVLRRFGLQGVGADMDADAEAARRPRVGSGFTLIVLAIVGVVAAYAIPAYQDYLARSRVGEGLSLASSARLAVAENASSGSELGGRVCVAAEYPQRRFDPRRRRQWSGDHRLFNAGSARRGEYARAGAIGAR